MGEIVAVGRQELYVTELSFSLSYLNNSRHRHHERVSGTRISSQREILLFRLLSHIGYFSLIPSQYT